MSTRLGRRIAPIALAATLSGTALCACVPIHHVTNVRVVDVVPASPADFAPGNRSDDKRYVEHYPDVLRLRLRSPVNLSQTIRERDADAAFVTITSCPFDDDQVVDSSGLTYRGRAVEPGRAPEGDAPPPYDYDAFFRYHALMDVMDWKNQPAVLKPLPQTPEDLCVKIVAPGFLVDGFISNEAVIPKAMLQRALEDLRARTAAGS